MWLPYDQKAMRRCDLKLQTSLWHKKSKATWRSNWVFPRRNSLPFPERMIIVHVSVWEHVPREGCVWCALRDVWKQLQTTEKKNAIIKTEENKQIKKNKSKEKVELHSMRNMKGNWIGICCSLPTRDQTMHNKNQVFTHSTANVKTV